MEGVEFNENQQARAFNTNRSAKLSAVTSLFIKIGLAKDQKQANTVMLVVSIICLLAMAYFIITTFYPGLLNF